MGEVRARQRDIVVAPIPYSDLSEYKSRPSAIISNDFYNNACNQIIVCGITSSLKNTGFGLLLDNYQIDGKGLDKFSCVKVDNIVRIDKNKVKLHLGTLKQDSFEHLQDLMDSILK